MSFFYYFYFLLKKELLFTKISFANNDMDQKSTLSCEISVYDIYIENDK